MTEKKTRADLTQEEIDALPEDHPWKHENIFQIGGVQFTRSDNDRDVEERERKEQERAEIEKQNRLLSWYTSASSGVPERYWDEGIDTFNVTDDEKRIAKGKTLNFINSRGGRILILCGGSGVGKSHLGCSIIKARGGRYISTLRLVYEIDSTLSYKAKETKIQVLDKYINSPMLVLDEIGRIKVREDVQKELVSYIISERYANRKPTVLISNLDKKAFVEWLGTAIYDRLCECADSIEFTGASYRIIKRNETFEK